MKGASKRSFIPGLERLRKWYGFTQLHVAICLDVSPKQVYLWEKKVVKPHDRAIEDLCILFKCTWLDLLYPSDAGPRNSPE